MPETETASSAMRISTAGAASYAAAMTSIDASGEGRIAELWSAIEQYGPDAFVARVELLVAELPAGEAIGLFERGSAQDSTGHPDMAVPLYRAALATGLTGIRRRRATIQLASSLRYLGNPGEAAELLAAEIHAASDELDGAVHAFLALALVDLGREREAVGTSLLALSRYLPRYNRSLARYAAAITATREQGRGARNEPLCGGAQPRFCDRVVVGVWWGSRPGQSWASMATSRRARGQKGVAPRTWAFGGC